MNFKIAFILLFPIQLFAQEKKNISFSANYLGGNIFYHTKKINLPQPTLTNAIEFSYKKQTLGNKSWQQRFGFPETALNVTVAQNGIKQLGYSIGLYPSIQFRLKTFKNSNLFFKFGGGIGIVTKYYKRVPTEDSSNNIIGGLVNNFTMFQIGYRQKINSHWSFQTGLDFFHTSNASARQPNFGINTYGAFVGINYHPQGFVTHFEKQELAKEKNPYNVGFRTTFGMAEDRVYNGPMFRFYNFTLYGSKMYRNKNRILAGLDMTFHSNLYSKFKNNNNYVGSEWAHSWRYSVFAGHEFVFGKIGFPLQLGYYLNRPNSGPKIYQKLGLNYHFYHKNHSLLKDVYLLTQLKTHFAQAEYAEFGFGFMF